MTEPNHDSTVTDSKNMEVKTAIPRESSDPAAELKGVWKIYHLGKTEVPAVRGVDLNIRTGDFATIAGPSGSGKSTLLNLLGCIFHENSLIHINNPIIVYLL